MTRRQEQIEHLGYDPDAPVSEDTAQLVRMQAERILTLEAALRRARDTIEGALLTSAMQEPCPPADYPANLAYVPCGVEWGIHDRFEMHRCDLVKDHTFKRHHCGCGVIGA